MSAKYFGEILRFVCETYEQSLNVSARVVQNWRETTLLIWKQFYKDNEYDWDEADPLYLDVMRAFDCLETIAQKYPPYDWGLGTA